ncbi:protein-disulfide reductase DsbD [Agrilutibacter solisilvae]|uniref:Thiol:disulfide interchange protein DsbD n=1 Tax=Agrilutibacter solisilvae TaxID=2763317 RepID=A0A974Y691_9GAMM|nr:protein-disulfide reductase DsbD [Lysobacter solisilvae]QSX79471.1 protein-disulfide reductase DsbD [Lysobacter solisilvae]
MPVSSTSGRRLSAAFAFVLSACSLLLPTPARAGSCTDDQDLMAVEEAFVLQASAPSDGAIRLAWKVAPGCYLYRHQIKVQAEKGFDAQALQLPAGEVHQDEFFGRVETYRNELVAMLPGKATGATATLRVRYQGCADAGICYPPQTRTLTVPLAGAAAAADSPAFPNLFGRASGPPVGRGLLPPAGPGAVDAAPLPPEQAFGFEAIVGDGNTLLLRFSPAPGYYLYRDKTSLKLDAAAAKAGITAGRAPWPRGAAHRDEHFGQVVVYFQPIELPLPLVRTGTGAARVTLTANFEGCQTDGICYPPMTRTVALSLPAGTLTAAAGSAAAELPGGTASVESTSVESTSVEGTPVDGTSGSGTSIAATTPSAASASTTSAAPNAGGQMSSPAEAPPALAEDSRLAAELAGKHPLWTLLVFFAMGLGLSFTPCVYPMIPILSGLIAGHGPGLGAGRALAMSFVYVLANALVFTAAGVIAGLLGANLQVIFQKPWVIVLFAALFAALAMSSFGLYELQMPNALRARLGEVSDRQRGGSWLGVATMGALSALIVGPCVAPPLAAAVLYIGQTQDPVLGGAALLLLGLGMGVPLLFFGVAVGKGMPTSGPWMVAVQRVFGFVFLGVAVWMLSRILPGAISLALWGALLLGAAAMLGLMVARPGARDGARTVGWVVVAMLAIAGTAQFAGALAGSHDPLQPLAGLKRGSAPPRALAFTPIKSSADLDRELAQAAAVGQPVLLDFYADWCVACKEMERDTFPVPAVRDALAGFRLLKADVTANDATDQALMKRLGIHGPPATLYFVEGRERRELRLFGFEPADKFVERAGRVSGAAPP